MLIDWDSLKGAYKHRCDSCGREFHGRKNRQYCTEKCKARYNNEVAAQRNLNEKAVVSDLLRNVAILARLIPEDNYDVEVVSTEKLEAMGFNAESANQRVTVDGEVWYKVGNYGFRPIGKSNEVELLRLE